MLCSGMKHRILNNVYSILAVTEKNVILLLQTNLVRNPLNQIIFVAAFATATYSTYVMEQLYFANVKPSSLLLNPKYRYIPWYFAS